MLSKKGLARISLFLACYPSLAGPGYAQQYPDRPVKIVVPFAAGGATDVAARLLAEEFKKRLGQQFIVDNRPGASGAIGIDAVAKAKPDGYTLGISGVGPTAILPFIDPKLPYSPAGNLDIIGRINAVGLILCARDDFPAGTVGEFLDYTRKNPGKVTYGSVGVASPNHILHEELSRLGGATMLHVPYSGESPIVTEFERYRSELTRESALARAFRLRNDISKRLGLTSCVTSEWSA